MTDRVLTETILTETIGTIATILAIAGVVLNNRRLRGCFAVWAVSNTLSAAIHLSTGILSLAVRDAAFLVLAVEGWILWGRERK